MEEKWKDVIGYENLYKISNFGNVLNIKSNKILKLTSNKEGYFRVNLRNKEYKKMFVHRLVAMAFIPNIENKPTVNHIDGNKLNNKIDNLEWNTYCENNKHARDTGLLNIKEKMCCKLDVNKNIIEIYASINEASLINGISSSQISDVCSGKKSHTNNNIFKFYDIKSKSFIKTKFDDENYTWTSGGKKSIKCIELDLIFSSLKDASHNLKISKSGIHSVLKKRQKLVSGYSFEYC